MPGSAGTRNMERLTLGDAARWRIARRSLRRGRTATVQGQGCSWRVDNTVDVGTTKKPTPRPLEERGEDGASFNPTLTAPPPHRSLAV